MKLTIGISPCPNDTFIFDALYAKKIDADPFEFEFILEDVETLNKLAIEGHIDIIKLSYAHYFNVLDHYIMLRSGGAAGSGVGPLLISKKPYHLTDIDTLQVAIPGVHTTANFLLSYTFPFLKQKHEYLFSKIEDAILREEVQAGVIIHENRFTYKEKGLFPILDLGEYWERKTNLAIPLGGIAMKRNLSQDSRLKINSLIKESIQYGKANYPFLGSFVKDHAQEMSEDIMRKHIDLYVNDFTIDMGEKGMRAIYKMSDIVGNNSDQQLFI